MNDAYLTHLRRLVDGIRTDGFYKTERVIASPQSPSIRLSDGKDVQQAMQSHHVWRGGVVKPAAHAGVGD